MIGYKLSDGNYTEYCRGDDSNSGWRYVIICSEITSSGYNTKYYLGRKPHTDNCIYAGGGKLTGTTYSWYCNVTKNDGHGTVFADPSAQFNTGNNTYFYMAIG